MKMDLVAEPDLVKELSALLAIPQKTSRCKEAATVCRLPTALGEPRPYMGTADRRFCPNGERWFCCSPVPGPAI